MQLLQSNSGSGPLAYITKRKISYGHSDRHWLDMYRMLKCVCDILRKYVEKDNREAVKPENVTLG